MAHTNPSRRENGACMDEDIPGLWVRQCPCSPPTVCDSMCEGIDFVVGSLSFRNMKIRNFPRHKRVSACGSHDEIIDVRQNDTLPPLGSMYTVVLYSSADDKTWAIQPCGLKSLLIILC